MLIAALALLEIAVKEMDKEKAMKGRRNRDASRRSFLVGKSRVLIKTALAVRDECNFTRTKFKAVTRFDTGRRNDAKGTNDAALAVRAKGNPRCQLLVFPSGTAVLDSAFHSLFPL